MLRAKVLAHHRHHAHLSEIAGRQREISRRPAQNALHAARRRRDVIKRNRTDNHNAHSERVPFAVAIGQWLVVSEISRNIGFTDQITLINTDHWPLALTYFPIISR